MVGSVQTRELLHTSDNGGALVNRADAGLGDHALQRPAAEQGGGLFADVSCVSVNHLCELTCLINGLR